MVCWMSVDGILKGHWWTFEGGMLKEFWWNSEGTLMDFRRNFDGILQELWWYSEGMLMELWRNFDGSLRGTSRMVFGHNLHYVAPLAIPRLGFWMFFQRPSFVCSWPGRLLEPRIWFLDLGSTCWPRDLLGVNMGPEKHDFTMTSLCHGSAGDFPCHRWILLSRTQQNYERNYWTCLFELRNVGKNTHTHTHTHRNSRRSKFEISK